MLTLIRLLTVLFFSLRCHALGGSSMKLSPSLFILREWQTYPMGEGWRGLTQRLKVSLHSPPSLCGRNGLGRDLQTRKITDFIAQKRLHLMKNSVYKYACSLCVFVSRSWLLSSYRPGKSNFSLIIGSLSKHNVDDSENGIWKCNFAFLQSFRSYSKSFRLQNVI